MNQELPRCQTNQISEQNTVNCIYCECYFENQHIAYLHLFKAHKEKVEVKRTMNCCKRNRRGHPYAHLLCSHCECRLKNKSDLKYHISSVHQCQKCRAIVLSDYQRDQHRIKHKKEDELKKLQQQQREEDEKQRKKNDDDLVLNYVKKNKLDEYQEPPDHDPDFDYILTEHEFEKEELLALVKRFDIDIFNVVYFQPLSEYLTVDDIIYLLENGAFTIQDTARWMDYLASGCFIDECLPEMVEYFLNKDYGIKPEWIAAMIYEPHRGDDQRLERIKEKYSFTFDEIFNARHGDEFVVFDKDAKDKFYLAVHKHFPDPDFEDPFADPYEEFKRVFTEHVHDHLQQRYFYDNENDELSIVVGYGENKREISMGHCKQMLKRDLQDLIGEYKKQIKVYNELDDEVSKGFEEMNEVDYESGLSGTQKAYRKEDIWHGLKDDIADRDNQANIVSKLYFVISMKPKDVIKTEATAKQWSVTIRRHDGTIVPLSSLKVPQTITR